MQNTAHFEFGAVRKCTTPEDTVNAEKYLAAKFGFDTTEKDLEKIGPMGYITPPFPRIKKTTMITYVVFIAAIDPLRGGSVCVWINS